MPSPASTPARRSLGRGPGGSPAGGEARDEDPALPAAAATRADDSTATAAGNAPEPQAPATAAPTEDRTATAAESAPEPPAPVTAVPDLTSEPGTAAAAPDGPAAEAVDGTAGEPGAVAAPGQEPAPSEAPAGGEARFTVRLANFEGPFDLLLQLIAKHKLDVTEVALSKVTDEFMAHIRAMGPDFDLDQTTEFLVVAATLLDLKAARLLPAAEIEDEADLALLEARDLLFARLLQYRAYKRIAEIFSGRLAHEGRRHPRTVGLEPHHAELLPEVVLGIGPERLAELAVKAMRPKPPPQVYVDHIHAPLVSVREQAEVVVGRLRATGEATFAQLTADAADTLTVVARFLALLELYREKAVALDQGEALGALTVRWTGGTDDAAPLVTDEFDREPQTEPRTEPETDPQTEPEESAR